MTIYFQSPKGLILYKDFDDNLDEYRPGRASFIST